MEKKYSFKKKHLLLTLIFVITTNSNFSQVFEPDWNFNPNNTPEGNRWMSHLPDHLSLAELTIPGTHDSGALYDSSLGLQGLDIAQCQDLSINQQLEMGVRYLDIRCRQFHDSFTIHHGQIYQLQNFDQVLTVCKNFLLENPNEVILMHIKQEHTVEGGQLSFEQIFSNYINENPSLWHYGTSIPTLGESRGKIVLIRRFNWDTTLTPTLNSFGIDVTNWADNSPSQLISLNNQQSVFIQDAYDCNNINKEKILLESMKYSRYHGEGKNTLCLNYASGNKKIWYHFFGQIPSIKIISNSINPLIENYFSNRMSRFHRNGIIILDFMNYNHSKLIYQTNFWKNISINPANFIQLFKHYPPETNWNLLYEIPPFKNNDNYFYYDLEDLKWIGMGNDELSSVIRGNNVEQIELFEHHHFGGQKYILPLHQIFVSNFNDKTSSLRFKIHNQNNYTKEKSITNNSNSLVKIYPNPFNDQFYIETQDEFKKIEIYNFFGKKIHENYYSQSYINFDFSDKLPGIYFLKLYFEKETQSFKIILE